MFILFKCDTGPGRTITLCKAKTNTPCVNQTDCLPGLRCTSNVNLNGRLCKAQPLQPCDPPGNNEKDPCLPGYTCVDKNGANICCRLNFC